MRTFKNLEEIWKTWKKILKNEWQPFIYFFNYFLFYHFNTFVYILVFVSIIC